MNTRETDSTEELPILDPAQLQADLDKAHRQIGDYKLLIADFENARKRLAHDAERQRKYAHEPLVRDIVAALDNLDRGLDAAKKAGETGPLVQGVTATAGQLLEVLRRYGVARMDVAPGTPFDPNRHEAVAQLPSTDVAPGQVMQVFQQGFLLHDRVLRPATVVVAASEES